MYTWERIFSQIKKYRRELFLGHLFAVLATVVSIPTPLFLPLLVDEVLLNKPGIFIQTYQRFLGEGNPVTYSKIFTKISKSVTYTIREDLLKHLKDVSMSEFETVGGGAISSKLVTDINTIDDFIGKTVSRLIISVLTIIGVAFVLIMINWKLGLLIVFLNPVVIYFTLTFSGR